MFPYEEKKTENVFDLEDFEFRLIANEKETKLKFQASNLDFNLPHGLHFGAIIHELAKQISVSSQWFSQNYLRLKHKCGIVFPKPQLKYASSNTAFVPAVKGSKKTLFLQVDVKQSTLKCDEDPLKLVFVNKSEAAEVLAEREIFRCKAPVVFKLLKKLKLSGLNEKAMAYFVKNFRMVFDVTPQLLDFNHVFSLVQRLDEARDCLFASLFKELDGAFHTYTADYIAWHVRNLQKPMIEVWGVDVRFLFINATLNPDQNPIFKTKVWHKIFDKYEVYKSFNKLPTKQYYDAEIKLDKIKAAV